MSNHRLPIEPIYSVSTEMTETLRKHVHENRTHTTHSQLGSSAATESVMEHLENVSLLPETIHKTEDVTKPENCTIRNMISPLPLEVHHNILENLTNNDVLNYACVNMQHSQIIRDNRFWYKRFHMRFDRISDGTPVEDYLYLYRMRLKQARKFVTFDKRREGEQKIFLHMLRELILQSDGYLTSTKESDLPVVRGHNHEFLRTLMKHENTSGSTILDDICNTDPLFFVPVEKKCKSEKSLVLLIQLTLLYIAFDIDISIRKPRAVADSQQQAYKCKSDEPVFVGGQSQMPNLPWLLHVANFFRYHIKTPKEGVLNFNFMELEPYVRPRAWAGKLETGKIPGRRWISTYTYLEPQDIEDLRWGRDVVMIDCASEHSFQDITLWFDIDHIPALQMPADLLLHFTNPKVKIDGEIPKVTNFYGIFSESSEVAYPIWGRIHALPKQQGIPGFQRLEMVAMKPDLDGQYDTLGEFLFHYETVVMPGNQIVLGRWTSLAASSTLSDGKTYSGPFMFWAVEENQAEQLEDDETAVTFQTEKVLKYMV